MCKQTHCLWLLAMFMAFGAHGQRTSTFLKERYILLPSEAKVSSSNLPPNVVLRSQRLEPAQGFSFFTHNDVTWVLPASSVKGRSIRIESGRVRPQGVDRTFRYCSCEAGISPQSSDCSLSLNEENNFGCTGHCNNQGRLVPCTPIDRHLSFSTQKLIN